MPKSAPMFGMRGSAFQNSASNMMTMAKIRQLMILHQTLTRSVSAPRSSTFLRAASVNAMATASKQERIRPNMGGVDG